jgi:hypothetical protein
MEGKVEAVRKRSFTVMSIAPRRLIIAALGEALGFLRRVGIFEDVAGLDDEFSGAVDEDAYFVIVGFDGEVE